MKSRTGQHACGFVICSLGCGRLMYQSIIMPPPRAPRAMMIAMLRWVRVLGARGTRELCRSERNCPLEDHWGLAFGAERCARPLAGRLLCCVSPVLTSDSLLMRVQVVNQNRAKHSRTPATRLESRYSQVTLYLTNSSVIESTQITVARTRVDSVRRCM